jgi:hypothetical protein
MTSTRWLPSSTSWAIASNGKTVMFCDDSAEALSIVSKIPGLSVVRVRHT